MTTISERLQQRLSRTESGCLEWQGHRNADGYGHIQIDGRVRKAHRIAWELASGPIPVGMEVCHRCDNPPCCNVDHLFLGTHRDNVLDMRAKGRGQPMPRRYGVEHHAAKLTPEAVRRIRELGRPYGVKRLSREYGVNHRAIGDVLNHRTWRDVA